MAYVVTQPCIGCKDTACVTACPTDCFHEGKQMLYIDPDESIDCGEFALASAPSSGSSPRTKSLPSGTTSLP